MNNEKLLKANKLKYEIDKLEESIEKCAPNSNQNSLYKDGFGFRFTWAHDPNIDLINATNEVISIAWLLLKDNLGKKLTELKREFENL